MSSSIINLIIKKFNLVPHPEGGFYKEIYRSNDIVKPTDKRYNEEERNAGTMIYYLLGGNDFSAWHKVNSDEGWNFCSGSSLTLCTIDVNGELHKIRIGDALKEDDVVYTYIVPHGVWFCAFPNDPNSYTLVTCNVNPGFDFKDFELANPVKFANEFPQHNDIIMKWI